MDIEIKINEKKSNVCNVKGVAIVDGIEVPFTAYRYTLFEHPNPATGQFDALPNDDDFLLNKVAVRSKSGILRKFVEKDRIKTRIRNAAKGWWIDHRYWRT